MNKYGKEEKYRPTMMDFLKKAAGVALLMYIITVIAALSCAALPTDAQELPQLERMEVVDSGYIRNYQYFVVQDTVEGNTCYFIPTSATLTCPLSVESSETTSEEY